MSESTDRKYEQMRGLVIDLCSAIHQYRFAHDNYGGDDIRTGRAWDLMRRTQERGQEALDPLRRLVSGANAPDPFERR